MSVSNVPHRPSTNSRSLGEKLSNGGVIAPGVFDALTAHLASSAGFDTLYLSGAAVAYTRLGRPDIGLVSISELADTLTLIRDRVDSSIIVDGDTGFGNAINVQRSIRTLERAGANAVQLEDQTFPKRCGHLKDKALVSASEMVGKVKAALDARRDPNMLIIARTDAIAVEGFERAIERAQLYAEAGADILFVEAPPSQDELARIVKNLATPLPLLANMVEGGRTPIQSAEDLHALGFKLVIFPGGIVRALALQAQDFYQSLRTNGQTNAFRSRMLDFDGLNSILGLQELLDQSNIYK